ncbi:hypothetical protein SSS_00392 [Sarcoptes scabiei]|uniref:Uncharacterized protein n=1 Tax=Sarcoptes scabiei TaxID=52283 RepID=A0A834VGL3_SARSC|nr:hypothetical protein SSS_00392 [Sarcoptes scabiei]
MMSNVLTDLNPSTFWMRFNDSSLIENLKPTREVLATMNGEITVTRKGNLVCEIYNGSEWKFCSILGMLVVKNHPFNVILISEICQATTNKDGITIFYNGEPVLCLRTKISRFGMRDCHRLSEDRRFLLPGFQLHLDIGGYVDQSGHAIEFAKMFFTSVDFYFMEFNLIDNRKRLEALATLFIKLDKEIDGVYGIIHCMLLIVDQEEPSQISFIRPIYRQFEEVSKKVIECVGKLEGLMLSFNF